MDRREGRQAAQQGDHLSEEVSRRDLVVHDEDLFEPAGVLGLEPGRSRRAPARRGKRRKRYGRGRTGQEGPPGDPGAVHRRQIPPPAGGGPPLKR